MAGTFRFLINWFNAPAQIVPWDYLIHLVEKLFPARWFSAALKGFDSECLLAHIVGRFTFELVDRIMRDSLNKSELPITFLPEKLRLSMNNNLNDLEKYFFNNEGGLIHKWRHYFEIYDRHFSHYRDKEIHIVEFGVSQGGSLQMWKSYFGPKAKIYGIDINPNCKKLEEEQVEIFIGDQEDRTFLRSLAESIPKIDILIDDGGHKMKQQINTFEELFPYVDGNGVYLCEDLHTSYWRKWGGGYKRRGTFIEYSKNFIDYVNAWHSEQKRRIDVSDFTKSVHSLHYYDSVLVIEKRLIEEPHYLTTGSEQIQHYIPRKTISQRIKELFNR